MPRAVRVLFVTHNVPRFAGDAAGSFVLRLAVALQSAGARVDVIAPGSRELAGVDTIEGVSIRRVRYASEQDMTLAYAGNMAEQVLSSLKGKFALVGLLRALRRAVREQLDAANSAGDPYSVVHAHWWFPAALSLWRSRRIGRVPLVITMHGSDVRLAQKITPVHAIMRSVLAQANVRTAVSSWLADRVHAIAPTLDVHVSPMPVDVRHFVVPPNDDHGAPSARHGVLFVGRLNAQKGLADLLAAMASDPVHSLGADRTVLHVVGDGPDAGALRDKATALGIADRVHWHGALPQPELVAHYQRARVLAIPSREEGLGLVAVEAQLCGTPVVAYADGGLIDVVRADHGGSLVSAGDVAALGRAIARLLSDDALASTLGARGRDDMLSRFSPDSVAACYLAHYREAVDRDAENREAMRGTVVR